MSSKKVTSVSLQEELDKADEKFDFKAALEKAIAALKSNEEQVTSLTDKAKTATESINALTESLAQAEADRDMAIEEMGALSAKLDVQERNQNSDGKVVEVQGQHFILLGDNISVKKNGERVVMTADEISKDSEVLDWMLSIKSGALVPAK